MEPRVDTFPIKKVMADVELRQRLLNCHMAVYNERGEREWSQTWTPEAAEVDMYELGREVHDTTYVTVIREKEDVVGFSVIAVGKASEVVAVAELPPGFSNMTHVAAIRTAIEEKTGVIDPLMAYYRHIGIMKPSRKGLALVAKLMAGPEPEMTRLGIRWASGWTREITFMYSILVKRGYEVIYRFPGSDKVHIGCLATPENWLRITGKRGDQRR